MLSYVCKTSRWLAMCVVFFSFLAGCSWFKSRPEFEGVEISKPLVVPAGLNKPSKNDALLIPAKSLIGPNAKSSEVISQFLVNDSVDNVMKRLGVLLPTIEAVTVLNKVDSIKSYEVRYGPDVFLISVQGSAQGGGNQSQVSAIGADGAVLSNKSASQLLAQLKLLMK